MDISLPSDIDDLVRQCKDPLTRSYVQEAVLCYKSGAFRSAIVNVWQAIVHNCVSKIEELALLGDKEAVHQKQALDNIRKTANVQNYLAFERNVLETIRDKFQMINEQAYIDLKRIQEDRHRSVHPLVVAGDEPFLPTAEIARHHVTVAVTKLLREGAVYGNAVHDRIMTLIDSPYFPNTYEQTKAVLDHSLLSSPKESLFRSILLVLSKTLLHEEMDFRRVTCYQHSIRFLIEKNHYLSHLIFTQTVDTLIDVTNNAILGNLPRLLKIDPMVWQILPEGKKTMVRQYVSRLPTEELDNVNDWLHIKDLRPNVEERVSRMTRSEFDGLIPFGLADIFKPRMVALYLESPSFDLANSFSQILRTFLGELPNELLEQILARASSNSQITGSFEFPRVIESIRRLNRLLPAEVDRILRANGLAEFIVEAPPAQA